MPFLENVLRGKRPDGEWSLMLVNKDQANPHSVQIVFHNENAKDESYFPGPVSVVTFGREQYQWHSNIKGGNGGSGRSSVAFHDHG